MSNEMETRTVNAPRTGTKVSWILAVSALAVAVYFYTSPTNFTGKDGGIFGCGSPLSPNNASLGKSQCHIIENASLHKAFLFLALALICAILGTILFGMEKSTQSRGSRSRLDDEHDDDEDDEHEEHDGRRSGLLSGRQERRSGGRRQEGRKPRLGDEDHADDEDDEEVDLRRRRSARVTRVERQDDEPRGERAARRRDRTESTRETYRPEDETSTRETTRSQRRGSRYDADAFDDTRD